MGGASFMQMPGADKLKKLVQSYSNMDSMDRRNVLAFFEQSGDYVPQSGQIVGILKAMKDDMEAELKKSTADEEVAVKGFGDLKASKEEEIAAADEAIRTKTARAGELAVTTIQTADDIEDTQKEVAENEKFLQGLLEACPKKEKEWEERQKSRAEEIQ